MSSNTQVKSFSLTDGKRRVAVGSIRVSDAVYYIALITYIICRVLDYSFFSDWGSVEKLSDALQIISIALLAFKIIVLTHYSVRLATIAALFLGALLLSYYASNSWSLLMMGLLVVGSVGCSRYSICKAVAWCTAILIAIVILFSVAGFIDTNITEANSILSSWLDVDIRNSFGFIHVNYLGMLVMLIFICRLILADSDMGKSEIVIWWAIAAALFFVVNTKTASCLIALCLIMIILLRAGKAQKQTVCKICMAGSVASLIVGIYLAAAFDSSNGLFDFVNRFLVGRVSFAHTFLTSYPLTPFGQHLDLVSTIEAAALGIRSQVLDNAYVSLLVHFGIVPFVLVVSLYFIGMKRSLTKGHAGICCAVFVLFVAGASEVWMTSLPGAAVLACMFDSVFQTSESDSDMSCRDKA